MSLELVRQAAAFAAPGPVEGLPPDTLRFALEYLEAPDPAAERARLADLLGADGFDLRPLDDALPDFLILQFGGLERRMAPQALFAAADALVEALGLVSAVPDIAMTYVTTPDDPSQAEAVGDLFLNVTCWVREDDSLKKDWSIDAIRARAAWFKATGRGVVIAQPDTGVADHGELAGAIDRAKGFNTLTGTADPTDPLSASMSNPGHGTATASSVASRTEGEVFGAAPGATVAPIRCLNAVVLGLDPTPVAHAILHAVRIKADVISMSLGGGFHSPIMAAALREAAQSNIIIVAAAGNCVQPIVVYPARDPNVIALAGSNHRDQPWKGSSRGARVDVAAPAENVFVARRSPDDHGLHRVKPSQGTSFATALTAGVAALWIEHFGRDAIRAEAARRGITVNELFRAAVKASARRPAGWDTRNFGAGIVNAEALLAQRLDAIPGAPPAAVLELASEPLPAALDQTFTAIETAAPGDWARIGAETVFLLNDAWMRGHRAGGVPMESNVRPRPSPGLATRLPAEVRTALATAAEEPDLTPPRVSEKAAAGSYIRQLAAGAQTGQESSAALTLEAAQARLKNGGADRLIQQADEVLTRLDTLTPAGAADRRAVMQSARAVLDAAAEDRLDSLDTEGRVSLEALVRLNDRPAYRVVNGTIDQNDPLFGEWGGFLALLVGLEPWTAAVGRINLDGTHIGTGFVMGDGLVMTNRHVLEAVADEVLGPRGSAWRFDRGAVTLDLSDAGDGSAEHALTAVVQAGPNVIGGVENLANLDLAILRADTALAPPLSFTRDLDVDEDLMVIGFPARPGTSALVDPTTGTISLDIAARLQRIFGTDFGRKYVSPGRFIQPPGALGTDTNAWVATHDGTTLGGSSGSVVVQLGAKPAVVGLHFSGAPLTSNKAHALGAVDASAAGPITGATWV